MFDSGFGTSIEGARAAGVRAAAFVCNVGGLLVALTVYGVLASPLASSPTLAGENLGPELQALEVAVSQSPDDAGALEALVEAYLDRSAPGLAQAALHRAPETIRGLAIVADLEARSLAALGRAEEALASQERALLACSRPIPVPTCHPFGAGAPNDNGLGAEAPNDNGLGAGAPNDNGTAAPNDNGTAAPTDNGTSERALLACAQPASSCSNAMLVHAERRVRWLRELVRLKVDDRLPGSAAASLAYRLAVREVRLAVP